MPEYPWLFDGSPDKPNERGLALITYVQWLGSWLESYPYYEDYERVASSRTPKLRRKRPHHERTNRTAAHRPGDRRSSPRSSSRS